MRVLVLSLTLIVQALSARAEHAVDRLVDAMGVPALIQSFAQDGIDGTKDLDEAFLAGQGGDVFYETARKLYAPDRLESELRLSLAEQIDRKTAERALLFFESELGRKIVDLEVQARQAMVDPSLKATAIGAAETARNQVLRLLHVRDLIDRNVEIAVAAQNAFYKGFAAISEEQDAAPDIESQRPLIKEETSAWVTGYYVLVASALSDQDLDRYITFWETDVGVALDTAMNEAFEASYMTLSFGLGQAIGRLLPQNEL